MGNKLAATWHGVPCDGDCCPRPHGTGHRRPFPVCYHGHACTWHLNQPDTGDRLHEQAYTYTGSHRTTAPQPDRSTIQPKSKAATWTPYRQAITAVQQQRAEREHAEHQAHVASLTAYLMKRTAFS